MGFGVEGCSSLNFFEGTFSSSFFKDWASDEMVKV